MIKKLANLFSEYSRKKRARIFWKHMQPDEKTQILDLGSEDGSQLLL
jgi:16S rRNA G1207 methylase RsmC